MIWEIIKKQAKIFSRDRLQLLLIIGLPILLIIILSVSLSSFISGDTIDFDANIGIIEHSNEQQQVDKFIDEIKETELPDEAKLVIIEAAESFMPIDLLKNEVLAEFDHMFHLEDIKPSEKEKVLNEEEFSIVIDVPEDFTYQFLKKVMLDEGNVSSMTLYEKNDLGAAAVKTIVKSFREQFSMNVLIAKNNLDDDIININDKFSGQTAIGHKKPINAKQYYTVGMAVMNVLYIASTVSSFAFAEKRAQVFNRIILTNVSRWTYFTGVFLSSSMFAFMQLLFIFGFSRFVFGVSFSALPFLMITLCVSFAVGALATLLTSISYRINSEQVTNFFGTILIAFLALVGGSFFPIGDLSNIIQLIGDFTPNGASMSAYLAILRGDSILEVMEHIVYLLVFILIVLMAAVISFPKRGQST